MDVDPVPLAEYCGLAAIVGFMIGTALAHFIIYARRFGNRSPIKGINPGFMVLVVLLMLGVSRLFGEVTPFMGEFHAVLVGVASQIVGAVIGFAVRRSMGLGPPPGF